MINISIQYQQTFFFFHFQLLNRLVIIDFNFSNIFNYIINKKMNGNLMRAPVISQIYNQKVTYENHLKKLDKIRQDRKNQLHLDQSRNSQLRQIKDSKSKSFAHKFNQQNFQINQKNIKFLTKLQKVKPFTRYSSHTTYDKSLKDHNSSFIKPVDKRKIIQTQKQNSRIFMRMKSVSSTLSKDKMLDDFYKAQQIKSRITKYANQNNKIALKSQKYFNQNKSFISSRSIDNKTQRPKQNLVSHYNKEDIIKNRISTTDHRLNKINKNNRGLPFLKNNTIDQTSHIGKNSNNKPGFFATQAENIKVKRSVSQKRNFK